MKLFYIYGKRTNVVPLEPPPEEHPFDSLAREAHKLVPGVPVVVEGRPGEWWAEARQVRRRP